MLDRASHSALVTGEWYIPGHRLSGFRTAELGSMCWCDTTRIGEEDWEGAEESSMVEEKDEDEEKEELWGKWRDLGIRVWRREPRRDLVERERREEGGVVDGSGFMATRRVGKGVAEKP